MTKIQNKDPLGLMKRDMAEIERVFKRKAVTPSTTTAEVYYQAGQQSVIDWMNQQLGGTDGFNFR